MTALRNRLEEEIAAKLNRHGIVIWDDPEGAYPGVVSDVVPASCTSLRFTGSWYNLRREIESLLAGPTPPTLLVYVPAPAPNPDPLEELRAVGSRYRITLPTLLRSSLKGSLTDSRITQISRECGTLQEAEAALEGGDTSIHARLISIIGDSSADTIAAHILGNTHASEIADEGLSDAARDLLNGLLGADFGTDTADSQLPETAFRHITAALLAEKLEELPESFDLAASILTSVQLKACRSVVITMRSSSTLRQAYVELAQRTDEVLRLNSSLVWQESLAQIDVTPACEELALGEAIRRLKAKDFTEALSLATDRMGGSWWLRSEAPENEIRYLRWRAVTTLATLEQALVRPASTIGSLADQKAWYESEGWQVDSAYRHAEFLRVTSGIALDEFDQLFHNARARYESWLDTTLQETTKALEDVVVPATLLQRSIYSRHVRKSDDRCAYVLVDALRYELGQDLANRLGTLSAEVTIEAAVATPPSITPVGMAALLPGSETSYQIDLNTKNQLVVSIDGSPVRGVTDRRKRLEHARGKIVDLKLDQVAQLSNKELKKKLVGTSLVLVRSTEIDSDGESDQLAASWGSFDAVLSVLHTAVAKLLHAGIQRVVITSDHGFLAVRQLGEDRRIDKPDTGSGEQHRRAWIGRGGTASTSTTKTALADFGVVSDLDIITPNGLGVFTSGGGLQFFHGGLSPQELIIPVIVVNAEEAVPDPKYQITMDVAGSRISTGIVVVTLTMTGDLFTRESRVRVRLTQNKLPVGIPIGGDGLDHSTGTIDATVDVPRIISLRVTADLVSGSTATLEVLDAATGVPLETLDIDVAADIRLDDDL